MRIREVLTAPPSPWQNPFAERLVGSVRRECLWSFSASGKRGLGTTLGHEARDGTLGDVDAELEELAVDARRPHRGFAAAIVLTRAAISVLTGGRPALSRPERRVQYSRKRRRCHRRTYQATR